MSIDVDLLSLRAFLVVCEQGSFAKAARQLFLSEPAVGLRMRVLEEQLGFLLFKRSRSGVRPTHAGEMLREGVARTLADLESCRAAARAASERIVSRITLASSPVTLSLFLPEVLPRFLESHPDGELVARSPGQSELVADLLSGAIDCAILVSRERPFIRGYEPSPLLRDTLGLAMAPSHPLADREALLTSELANERLFYYARSQGYRQLVKETLSPMDLSFEDAITVESAEPLKKLVEHGIGVAFFPLVVVYDEVVRGSLVFRPLVDAPLQAATLTTWFCAPRRRTPRGELRDLKALVVEAAIRIQARLDAAVASAAGVIRLDAARRGKGAPNSRWPGGTGSELVELHAGPGLARERE